MFALTHALVDDARLATRLSDAEARQVRRYLEQYAEPESTRHCFQDGDALRTAALVFDKAVDMRVDWLSVVKAIEFAQKKVVADSLKMTAQYAMIADKRKPPREPLPPPPPAQPSADDLCCVVCMDSNRNATMQCGHANLCFPCGEQMDACPTCRAPKQSLIKLYQ